MFCGKKFHFNGTLSTYRITFTFHVSKLIFLEISYFIRSYEIGFRAYKKVI
jgi:hypothetical protein